MTAVTSRPQRRAFTMVAIGLAAFVGYGVLMTAQGKSTSLPNPDSSNFKDLDQITKANVGQLRVA